MKIDPEFEIKKVGVHITLSVEEAGMLHRILSKSSDGYELYTAIDDFLKEYEAKG